MIFLIQLIREFFGFLGKSYNWLFTPSYFGVLKAGYLIIGSLVSLPFLKWLHIPNKLSLSLVGEIVFSVLVLGMFKFRSIRLPRFFTGGTNIPIEIIQTFSHRAYLFCITYFSIYISLIIYVPIALAGLGTDKLYTKLILIVSAINTVLWFMYHLLLGSVSVKQVKARVSLYSAISGTLSPLLVGNIFNSFVTVLGAIGIGYLWLQFCTEQVELEQESSS